MLSSFRKKLKNKKAGNPNTRHSNKEPNNQFSREENIALAQMAEQIGNYEDMFDLVLKMLDQSDFNLSAEERLLFSTAFKHRVSVILLRIEKLENLNNAFIWREEHFEYLMNEVNVPRFKSAESDTEQMAKLQIIQKMKTKQLKRGLIFVY